MPKLTRRQAEAVLDLIDGKPDPEDADALVAASRRIGVALNRYHDRQDAREVSP